MDLRASLLELLLPLRAGEELAGARLIGASDEIGPRLLFDVAGESLEVEVAPANGKSPAAAASPRLRFAYIASGARSRAVGLGVARAVARLASTHEERVLRALDAEAAEHEGAGRRVRELRVDHALVAATFEGRVFHTLSPYVGCVIGCRFCYAQSPIARARQLAGRDVPAWGSFVDVRVNLPDVLTGELETRDVRVIKLCPVVSDPYQALEETYEVTRRCLDVMAEARARPLPIVLTRSRLVSRDLDRLAALGAWVGVSLPTADDEVRAHFEPRAASIAERLEILRRARSAGATPFAVVQPLLPGSLDRLADALARHCASASIDVLRGLEGSDTDFADPRYAHARDPAWQEARAHELTTALRGREVELWRELPPELASSCASRDHGR